MSAICGIIHFDGKAVYKADLDIMVGSSPNRGPGYGRFRVERVSPYFDRRIVEYVMAVPTEQLSFPGQYRRLQTNAMKRVLPTLIYQSKKKASFDALLKEGLLEREKETVAKLMRDPLLVSEGWVDGDWLTEQWRAGEAWEMDGYPFSMCLHLELWFWGRCRGE